MLSPGTDPLRVKPIEVGDVEGIQDATVLGGEGQLLFVGHFDEAGVDSGDHLDSAGTKRRDKVAVHSVFVDVDVDLAHRPGSAPVLLFQRFRHVGFCFEVGLDLRPVGVVVSKSGMNLRQRKLPELPHDLLRNQAHVVPLSDAAYGDAGTGDTGPPPTNVGAPRDQAADFGDRSHRLQV